MNECAALVEKHWRVKTEVLGENTVPVHLMHHKIQNEQGWD